jgi:YidC/Oxa1 family membrane protein insertase
MQDDRRLFSAVILIMAFLYIWFTFIAPPPKPAPTKVTSVPVSGQTPAQARTEPSPTSAKPAEARPGAPDVKAVLSEADTPLSHLRMSSRYGAPEKIELKKYRVAKAEGAPNVTVVPFMGGGAPPLRWKFVAGDRAFSDDGANYREVSRQADRISYEWTASSQLTVRKTLQWSSETYAIEETVALTNSGAPLKVAAEVSIGSGTHGAKNPSMMNPGDPLHLLVYANEDITRLGVEKLTKPAPLPRGDIWWAGFDSRYFLLSMIPVEGKWTELAAQTNPGEPAAAEGSKAEDVREIELSAKYLPRDVATAATQQYVVKLYAGPKEIGTLQTAGGSLEKSIDLGGWLLGPIARVILRFLRVLHAWIPNFGLAIILLTVLVRLALFPLAHLQGKSMKRMQHHKPQMDALKEKYKDNKEAYSRELMTYMRTHKINPMGGCMLLLPQLPVFFALYRVLYNSIDLRHAPFVAWIQDLSAHDPYFVTPVILGVLMFIQQRMTPMPGADPAQQSMMKIMPVMFSVFMLFLPAGLNLYILVSTLWGIGQQYWIGHSHVEKGASHKIFRGS